MPIFNFQEYILLESIGKTIISDNYTNKQVQLFYTSNNVLGATRARHKRHRCYTSDTSATRTTRVRRNDVIVARMKNFDKDTSQILFSHPYLY